MGLIRDARGQSVVIGSLLIFTVLILAFSGYQAFAVPDQNAEVEAEHFQTVEDQFARLQGGVVNAVGEADTRSTSIALGTQYPSRAFALNPPPAAGRLETTAPGDVEFATSESVCRADGTATTRSLVYTPGYNEFREPRAVGYENRVLSREFEGGTRYDQRLVRSSGGTDEISLFLLTGGVSENGVSSYSLELNGSNRHTTTLTNPQVTLPSRFDAATWEDEILADRSDVTAAPATSGRVELSFDGGDYRVSCAVAGLDSDPAFSPPSDVDTGTDGDAAYSTEWLDPSGESGTTSCSDTQCTLDASVSKTLGLTAETTPPAQDATVSFSVSNDTVGTVAPATNETGSDGRTLTRMRARSNGTMKMYAASGGSGDVINITVENLIPFRGVVFTDGSKKVTTAEQPNRTTTLDPKADVLGPPVADINNDGTNDIPYVPSGGSKVHIVDQDGRVTELSSNAAKSSKSLLGVGRWNGTRTSVFFAGESGSTIYRTNPSEGDVQVVKPGSSVSAVAGPADIDGDDANELVYADGSQQLRYFEPGAGPGSATGTKIQNGGLGSNNGIGLGRPADFDGDGTARIPAVGDNKLFLIDANGNKTVFVSNAAKSPVATVDWDNDGELEVMYITTNGNLKYVDNVAGGQIEKDTEIDNAEKATGVT